MKKILKLFLGIIILALGTSICNYTGLGIDPFNAFCTGIATKINISLGTFILILQFVIAIFVFLLNRKYLGIGTIIPMLSFGYALEVFNWIFINLVPVQPLLILNIIIFLLGMIIIALGMSIYMNCDLGMVPYDSFAFVISEKIQKNAFLLRVVLDISIAILALLVKGPINIGTILLAFSIGPLLNITNKYIFNQ